MRTTPLVILFILCCPLLQGCLALFAAAGTGATVMYVKGDLDSTLVAAPPAVIKATVDTLREMDMHIISEDASEIDGRVVARTATDKRVTVNVKRGTVAGQSDISIRLNVFGDEQLSRLIYERIRARLRDGEPTRT